MKLKNKKTGEIDDFIFEVITDRIDLYRRVGNSETKNVWHYNTIAELNADWEDVPEKPKGYWYINEFGTLTEITHTRENIYDTQRRNFGNYFETKEEAEKAVEKLKIYNKLKQKGFVFSGWYYSTEGQLVILADNHEFSETEPEDLTELFGDKIC